jgi:hypothetical protein
MLLITMLSNFIPPYTSTYAYYCWLIRLLSGSPRNNRPCEDDDIRFFRILGENLKQAYWALKKTKLPASPIDNSNTLSKRAREAIPFPKKLL